MQMRQPTMVFTLNPRVRPRVCRANETGRGGGVFLIVDVAARLDGQPQLQTCTIYGTLSVITPYYEYVYGYQRKNTKYGLTYYLQGLRASRPVPALRYEQVEWMLRYELGMDPSGVQRVLQRIPGGASTALAGERLLQALPRPVYERLVGESAYFRESAATRLGSWFPHLSPAVLEERLHALGPERAQLEQLVARAPWRLALYYPTKRWHACGLPVPVNEAFAAALQAFEPPDRDDEDSEDAADPVLECTPTPAELRAAVRLENQLRARQKRRGDLVFLREDAVPAAAVPTPTAAEAADDDEDAAAAAQNAAFAPPVQEHARCEDPEAAQALALLVAAGSVECRTVEGRTVYALYPHARVRQKFSQHLERLLRQPGGRWGPPLNAQNVPWDPAPQTTRTIADEAGLCPEQARGLHAAVEYPLSALTGGPGCGKTRVIETMVSRFSGAFVAVRTLTGSMAAALRERGIAGGATLHRGLYRLAEWGRQQERGARRTPFVATLGTDTRETEEDDDDDEPDRDEMEARVQVLIIDEASNVSEKLLVRILRAYPSLMRLVLVFDPEQIPPISAGQPAIDILRVLPACAATRLTINHRVAADVRTLIENDRALVARRFSKIHMANLELAPEYLAQSAPPPPADFQTTFAATGSAAVHVPQLSQPARLRQCLHWTLQHLVAGGAPLVVAHLRDVLVIVLTNDLRRQVNGIVESLVAPAGRPRLYPGLRLTITDRNYPRRAFSWVRGKPRWSPLSKAAAGPASQVKSPPLDEAPARTRTPKGLVSDEVSNGELFVFHEYCDYDTKTKRWGAVKQTLSRASPLQPARHVLRVLRMAGGQQIVLGGSGVGGDAQSTVGVAPGHLQTAWAITVDKAQGRQEHTIIKLLPPPAPVAAAPGRRPRYAQCFRRNHAHVSLSRAEHRFILLGELSSLYALARRAPRPRFTLLATDLQGLFAEHVRPRGPGRHPTPTERIDAAVGGRRTSRPHQSSAPPDALADPAAFLRAVLA